MPAAKINLAIEGGAVFFKRLAWRDKNKKLVKLTGASAMLQVYDKDHALLLTMSTENGRIALTDPGIIELKLTPQETWALDFESGSYQLMIRFSVANQDRLAEGRFAVSRGQVPPLGL